MTKINYPATSPYSQTPQNSWSIGLYSGRAIPADPSDMTVVVQSRHHNRPDLLSYDLYGTVAYWWIFMVRNINLIRDPIYDLVSGMEITVPAVDYLKKVIG